MKFDFRMRSQIRHGGTAMLLQPGILRLFTWPSRIAAYSVVVWIVFNQLTTAASAHGHMIYPPSRATEHIKSDVKNWPVAGIPVRLRREPCVGLKPNATFTKIEPGPLTIKLLFPDGANHKGYCNAFLYDPVKPHGKLKIGETTNCGRSLKAEGGVKGQDIPGIMPVTIPEVVPCDPAHCVLLWEWTATHMSETNIESFENYDDCADISIAGAREGETFNLTVPPGTSANDATHALDSKQFFAQDWRLNLDRSFLYLQSVKNTSVFETHGFKHMEGTISPEGDARVTLDLASFDTGIDLRNVRMRFLFFKTFQFPEAVITARLDKSRLEELQTKTSLTYPLDFTIELHGITKQMTREVIVTRVADSAVSVAVIKPIIIPAKDFGFEEGIGKLEEAAGVVISPAASITFDLVFEGLKINPKVEQTFAVNESNRIKEQSEEIDATKCETRLNVLSESRSVYFKLGSADLDEESHFALDQIAEFAFKCPDVKIKVSGHTDNLGNSAGNVTLSKERAQRVVDYLVNEGVPAAKLIGVGYGDKFPEVPNNSLANRAKNRRIVFSIMDDI